MVVRAVARDRHPGLKRWAVGRRNHFGSKCQGTEVAATLYTHDIDPAAYIHATIVAADRDELHDDALARRLLREAGACHDVAARGLTINRW